ncbi:Cobalt/zinc/cadmium efflux RND transporter, membrane fusion protein, CzcB family [Pseudomonas chlororaphis subsp. aureofaciens]|nr:Cobalt/zinc/cadmium efflux RND transporter, membrane fusion protein, CzcB family [Pseudomonas chlororaphis subsp. aureofaciens]
MNSPIWKVASVVGVSLALGVAGGYWLAQPRSGEAPAVAVGQQAAAEPKALYWYDPMYPQQKFDKPGKSPFMDMQLVPRYAEGQGERGIAWRCASTRA